MLESIVNDELSNVYNWLTAYKLSLNRKKTMLFFDLDKKKGPSFVLVEKLIFF